MSVEKETLVKKEILVEIKNVYKDYKLPKKQIFAHDEYIHAVQGVTISLERGKIYGLVGESGCGKTTLAKMIGGVEEITKGDIYFKGESIKSWVKRNRLDLANKVQLILQDASAALPPNKRVKEILEEPLEIHGVYNKKERIDEVLNIVNLPESVLTVYQEELSAGVKQKINIARALLLDVELIISDESISSLDPKSQIEIMNLFKKLNRDENLTIIFIAHDISTIYFLCDVVIVMYLGTCVEMGKKDDLFNNPLHPYTKALMAAVPTIDKGIKNEKLYILEGEVPSPTEILPGCNFYMRCFFDKRDKECEMVKPQLKEFAPDHWVSCIKL